MIDHQNSDGVNWLMEIHCREWVLLHMVKQNPGKNDTHKDKYYSKQQHERVTKKQAAEDVSKKMSQSLKDRGS